MNPYDAFQGETHMNILVCGASGFVGRHLVAGLRASGHTCIRGIRRLHDSDDRQIDYLNDLRTELWLPKLQGIDVVINAVGILRDTSAQPMQKILFEAPAALFRACSEAGVNRVVNVSALGDLW